MTIEKFKVLEDGDQYKGLVVSYSNAQLAYGDGSDSDADQPLTYYYVDRQNSAWNTDDLKNLFMSFGLSKELDSEQRTELNRLYGGAIDWYSADRMLIVTVPQSGVSSYIDGSTAILRVPTGTTSGEYVEFYASTFEGQRDDLTGYDVAYQYVDKVYGGASAGLFVNTFGEGAWAGDAQGDGIQPYTGTIDGASHPNAGISSWSGVNVEGRAFYPHARATHQKRDPDSGLDFEHGVAFLEKGIFVLFDDASRTFLSTFLDSTGGTSGEIWTAGTASFGAVTATGGTYEPNTNVNNRRAIAFTGSAANVNSRLYYRTVNEDYKLSYFCHAGQNEFNSTSNHTYNHRKAFFRPEESDDIYVTEIALYDDSGDGVPLAYAKLSEPVLKNQLETLTFKVTLDIGNE